VASAYVKTAEEIRKIVAQAEYTELQVGRLKGELVPVVMVESFFARALVSFRQQIEHRIADEAERARIALLLTRALDTALAGIRSADRAGDGNGHTGAEAPPETQRLPVGRTSSGARRRGVRTKPKGAAAVQRK
jgi:hypothetical protein